ncbi:hypothetical protein TSTA_090520 [Talaromyces stipitatus ATCC 10500]|uniref:Uncharacterized protein n=1 Tax=Talaromyces stipitatus (strain ATCC 10500 / CBS 375.48 / QM 6759 / NRRL 1006) TaxID=441959 RepID=B8M1B7_TALSN|nr:uncharacterized protein TSTA_090520 [Talaromyces stipitatus ATCC 10500]EED21813.1 hypothetical protein TSTA_090520 [Talaromyces stipitatus ATCC 10500]
MTTQWLANDTPSYKLFGVPANTPEYRFRNEQQGTRLLAHEHDLFEQDQSGQQSQYVIFSNVDDKTYNRYFIYFHDHDRGSERTPQKRLALVKMTINELGVATEELNVNLMRN